MSTVDFEIAHHSHGKARVKLLRLDRGQTQFQPGQIGFQHLNQNATQHTIKRFDVQVRLLGTDKPLQSFLAGENKGCVATDSVKNTVYCLAQKHPLCSKEDFALIVGRHL